MWARSASTVFFFMIRSARIPETTRIMSRENTIANVNLAAPLADPGCVMPAPMTPMITTDHRPWIAWMPSMAFIITEWLTIVTVVQLVSLSLSIAPPD